MRLGLNSPEGQWLPLEGKARRAMALFGFALVGSVWFYLGSQRSSCFLCETPCKESDVTKIYPGRICPIHHIFCFPRRMELFKTSLHLTQLTKPMWGMRGSFLMGNLARSELLPASILLMLMDCKSWVVNISTALFSLLCSENLQNFRSILAKLLLILFFFSCFLTPFSIWE